MSLGPGADFGQYRIESLIGRGGMGSVYLATDQRLGRRVALKLLSPELGEQPAFRDRFVAESRAAASLDNPHIVPVYEAGDVNGRLFIAMRFVQGADLDVLLRKGPMPVGRAVGIVAQMADGLDAAHSAGLIHRDVKPGNILVSTNAQGEDHAYLSDFGLTTQAAYGAGATRTGQLVGTVDYVAPEQIEGRPIDNRVDIYSLGCVLYEALSGAPPFRRETEVAVLFAHMQSSAPPLHDTHPEIPEALDAVLARAIARDPDERYDTAGEFARAALLAIAPGATPVEAGTRGFLFADLRGYTAFVEERGDAEAAKLLERYRLMVREVVARQYGSEVRTEGDSFYVLFPTASRAVTAALEIVAEAAKRTAERPDAPIRVGVGVHAGETAETAEGPVGSAVNLAARICGQAQAGEVLVSETVRGLTRTRQVAAFEPVGSRRLKGIAEAVSLFRALAPGQAVASGGRRPPGTNLGLLNHGAGGRRAAFALSAVALGVVVVVGAVALRGATTASPSPTNAATTNGGGGGAASQTVGATAGATAVPQTLGPPSPTAAITPAPVPPATPVVEEHIAYSAEYVFTADTLACDPGNSNLEAHISIARPDGSSPARLIPASDVWEREPTWSPDGSQLAFVGFDPATGGINLYVINSDGTGQKALLPVDPNSQSTIATGVLPLSWSPDGRWLSVLGDSADGRVAYVVPVRGGDPIAVRKPAARTPDPTPDPSGSIPEPAPTEQILSAAFMPDGRVSVVVAMVDGTVRLFAVARDGSGWSALTGPLPFSSIASLAWSPDGTTLAVEAQVPVSLTPFLKLANTGPEPSPTPDLGPPTIYVMNADGRGVRPLTSGISPAWAPAGSRLMFADAVVAGSNPKNELFVIDADGTHRSQITHSGAGLSACSATWTRTSAVVVQPTPTPGPDATPVAGLFHLGRLDPGAYVTRAITPQVEFTLPAGWRGLDDSVDEITAVGPTQEITVARIQTANDPACLSNVKSHLIGPSPRDLVDWLGSRPFLKAGQPFPVNIASFSGLQIDVELAKPLAKLCPDTFSGRLHLFLVGQNSIYVFDGGKARFIALDVNGKTVTIEVQVRAATQFDEMVTGVQPIIDSLQFAPASP